MSFAAHREKLYQSIAEKSLVVVYAGIPIHRNEDAYHDFAVNSQYFYLTGLERENTALVAYKGADKISEILFIEEPNPQMERWTGKYGGNGIVPSSSNISIRIPSYNNLKCLIPSSASLIHSAFSFPSPKDTIVPTFILLAGLTRHSQSSFSIFFNNNTSITAFVSSFIPINLAGKTLVSFNTKVSPFSK